MIINLYVYFIKKIISWNSSSIAEFLPFICTKNQTWNYKQTSKVPYPVSALSQSKISVTFKSVLNTAGDQETQNKSNSFEMHRHFRKLPHFTTT